MFENVTPSTIRPAEVIDKWLDPIFLLSGVNFEDVEILVMLVTDLPHAVVAPSPQLLSAVKIRLLVSGSSIRISIRLLLILGLR